MKSLFPLQLLSGQASLWEQGARLLTTGCSDCVHTARLPVTSRLYQQFLTCANRRTFLSSGMARLCTKDESSAQS